VRSVAFPCSRISCYYEGDITWKRFMEVFP